MTPLIPGNGGDLGFWNARQLRAVLDPPPPAWSMARYDASHAFAQSPPIHGQSPIRSVHGPRRAGRGSGRAPSALPTVRQRLDVFVRTRAINFCRKSVFLPTLQSSPGLPRAPWDPGITPFVTLTTPHGEILRTLLQRGCGASVAGTPPCPAQGLPHCRSIWVPEVPAHGLAGGESLEKVTGGLSWTGQWGDDGDDDDDNNDNS